MAYEAAGEYRLGEARGAEWLLSRRVSGFGPGAYLGFLVTLVVLEIALPSLVDRLIPGVNRGLIGMALVFLVGAGGVLGWLRLRQGRLRKGWIERGLPNASPTTFRIEPDVLVVAAPLSETRIQWAAVSEIARGKGFWCLIGPGLAYCLPRRFFNDIEAERVFLRAALERMGEAARARSDEAKAFVGVWG